MLLAQVACWQHGMSAVLAEKHLAECSVCEPIFLSHTAGVGAPFCLYCRLLDFDLHDKQGTQQPLDSSDLAARPLFFTGDCRPNIRLELLLPV